MQNVYYVPRWWDAGVYSNLTWGKIGFVNTSASGAPSWKPDGSALISSVGPDLAGFDQIFHLPVNGAAPVALTSVPSFKTFPTYSPDGAWITFLSDGPSQALANSWGATTGVAWSPDSSRMALSYTIGGKFGVATVDLAGRVTFLTQPVYDEVRALEWQPPVAPNGRLAWRKLSYDWLTSTLSIEVSSTRNAGDKIVIPGFGNATWASSRWRLTATTAAPLPVRLYACGLDGCITR